LQFISIDVASLSVPNLIGMIGEKIEALEMHLGFVDFPTTSRLIYGVGQNGGHIELEQAVHVAEGVDRVQLVAHDTDSL